VPAAPAGRRNAIARASSTIRRGNTLLDNLLSSRKVLISSHHTHEIEFRLPAMLRYLDVLNQAVRSRSGNLRNEAWAVPGNPSLHGRSRSAADGFDAAGVEVYFEHAVAEIAGDRD